MDITIPNAYRQVLRASLRAVKYSKPARYVIASRVRHFFRSPSSTPLDEKRFKRTLEFLDGAAKYHGVEHRLLRGLIRYWDQDRTYRVNVSVRVEVFEQRQQVKKIVDHVVEQLGKSMDIYI